MINKKSKKISTTKALKSKKKLEAPSWLLKNIAEASKHTRTTYFFYIGLLIYCYITLMGTPDRQIILNDAVRLPFFNLELKLLYFLIIAPLLLIVIFIYLQLHIIKIKQFSADIHANFVAVEKRLLYPWLITFAENPDKDFIGKIQIKIIKITLWYSLPLILMGFLIRIIAKHDLILSYFVAVILLLGTYIVLLFWCKYDNIHKNYEFKIIKIFDYINNDKQKNRLALSTIIFELFFLCVLIPFANEYKPCCLDLSYQVLAAKPQYDYEGVYWLDLKFAHLEGANLESAVLMRSNLLKARLQRANLFKANLQQADLQGANLMDANLKAAILKDAKLQKANLATANLREADLKRAYLLGATLNGVNFQDSILDESNFQGATLKGAKNLTIEQLSKVKTLYQAQLDPELEKEIKEKYPQLLEKPEE